MDKPVQYVFLSKAKTWGLHPGNELHGSQHYDSHTYPKAEKGIFANGHDKQAGDARNEQHRRKDKLLIFDKKRRKNKSGEDSDRDEGQPVF